MILRRIASGDLPALAALHAQSFARAWSAGELGDMAARPGAVALLAAASQGADEPLGFILCWRTLDEAEVLTLMAAPPARGAGLGGALLEEAMAVCAAEGAGSLFLEVAQDNAPALALYRRAGFTQTGRRRGYYHRPPPAAPVDALMLQRRLTAAAQPLIVD